MPLLLGIRLRLQKMSDNLTKKITDLTGLIATAKNTDEALMFMHITVAYFASHDMDIPNELCRGLAEGLRKFKDAEAGEQSTNGFSKLKPETETEN